MQPTREMQILTSPRLGARVILSVRQLTLLRTQSAVLVICFVLGCASSRSLPPIPEADEIRIGGITGFRVVEDRDVIDGVVRLVNQNLDGWSVPRYGPPAARTNLAFYLKGEFVADFGLGNHFFSRTHENFYSRMATTSEIQAFRAILSIEDPYVE